jgi:hypothetical protein
VVLFNRLGAEEARGAHNSEVVRSKRTAGNHYFNKKKVLPCLVFIALHLLLVDELVDAVPVALGLVEVGETVNHNPEDHHHNRVHLAILLLGGLHHEAVPFFAGLLVLQVKVVVIAAFNLSGLDLVPPQAGLAAHLVFGQPHHILRHSVEGAGNF